MAHTKKPRMPECEWTDNEDGPWDTSCDNMFEFTTDGPKENGFVYCPYCGRILKVCDAKKRDSD